MTTPELDPAAPASAVPDAMLRRVTPLRARLRGPWRVAVVEGSMLPTIRPGDWLLVDPTTDRWPRRGSIVVFTEPDSQTLSVKRVAGQPGDRIPFEGGYLHLGPDEAWLLADANDEVATAAGFGTPVDSRRFGPVPLELLVGRVWFRYGPLRRIGLLPGRPGSRGSGGRRLPQGAMDVADPSPSLPPRPPGPEPGG